MTVEQKDANKPELNESAGAEKSLTSWKNEPSVTDLKQDYTDAQHDHSTQVTKIETWLDNLNITGSAKIKKKAGQSAMVPQLIRKQAEWRYAALSEPFLSTEDVFEVKPATHNDKEAAQQNELVLNNQLNTQIEKTKFIDDYVRTAVDEGTVIVRVGWEFEEEEYEEEIPEVEFSINPELAPLHEELHKMMENNPEQYEQEVPDELKEAHEMTMEEGQPVEATIVGMTTETRTRTVKNRPTLEVCDFRNVILDPTAQGDMNKASFVIYSFESSMSELEKDGKYKNLKAINVANSDILGQPDHATENTSNFNFSDDARKKFVVYEYWGYWDIEGNGKVEPIVAAWVGNTLIRMEKNPFPDKKIPFIKVQYLPVRRSNYGEPDGALLEDNQKIMGALTRGMIDIMGKSANGQTGIRKDALDTTNKRKFDKGEDYEFNPQVHPDNAFYMHTWPEIPSSSQFMMQLQNQDAEALTGVKAFAQGVTGDSLGETATGVRGALDAASKRELGILRRLSEGLTEIGRKFISMNGEFLSEEEVVRRTDEEFVPIRRDDLSGKFDLKLAISTPEADEQKAQDLTFMLQTMGNNMDPALSKILLADMARLKKMPALSKQIEQHEPQPDPMAQEKAKLENELLKAQIANERSEAMENQAEARLDGAKASEAEAKAENIQSDTDKKDLDFVEQESGVTQERQLEQNGEQAKSNAELKLLEKELEREDESSNSIQQRQQQINTELEKFLQNR